VSPGGPSEERVVWNERFQGERFDFSGRIVFARFDRCEFVKCTLLIDDGTEQLAFPDYPAPVVRSAGDDRDPSMMRWACRHRRTGGPPVTSIRNTSRRTGEAG